MQKSNNDNSSSSVPSGVCNKKARVQASPSQPPLKVLIHKTPPLLEEELIAKDKKERARQKIIVKNKENCCLYPFYERIELIRLLPLVLLLPFLKSLAIALINLMCLFSCESLYVSVVLCVVLLNCLSLQHY